MVLRIEHLIAPHGGRLVSRLVNKGERSAIEERTRHLPRLVLKPREVSDLFLLGIGAFSPLEGFMDSTDYRAVVREGRLANGLPWTIPITLSVSYEEDKEIARPGTSGEIGLYDQRGKLLGTLQVREVYRYDREEEALHVYGTTETSHPGVAYVLGRSDLLLGGPITLIDFPLLEPICEKYFLQPSETRAVFKQREWKTIVAFQTRNPIHRAHEYIQRCALETMDGLLIHPLVGETKPDDVPAPIRMRCYLALVNNYYPESRVLLSVFPAAMRYAGPREAIFHALVQKNFGCTHIIVGRDHAGVGNFYGPYDAQRIFERYDPGEIGIQPLFFESTFYCRRCGHVVSEKTCRHDGNERIFFNGTNLRDLLRRGKPLPPEFTRPEVAEILSEAYCGVNL